MPLRRLVVALMVALLCVMPALAQGPEGDEADADTASPEGVANLAAPRNAPQLLTDPTGMSFISSLRNRHYGGGEIERVRVMEDNDAFTRYLIRYPSDDLTIVGFMDVPKGVEPPYRAVVVAHGYVYPRNYPVLAYTTPYADALARAGFLVVHPNYRGHGASDDGPNPFRSGYTVDVLNLVEILKADPTIRPDGIGLFGHSMGGEVAIKALVVSPTVRAAVLYAAMSGDAMESWRLINNTWAGGWFLFDGPFSPWRDVEAFRQASPINYLDNVQAPVQLHHGTADATVPLWWSRDLAGKLRAHGKEATLFEYAGQPHGFGIGGWAYNSLMGRTIDFFDANLK